VQKVGETVNLPHFLYPSAADYVKSAGGRDGEGLGSEVVGGAASREQLAEKVWSLALHGLARGY